MIFTSKTSLRYTPLNLTSIGRSINEIGLEPSAQTIPESSAENLYTFTRTNNTHFILACANFDVMQTKDCLIALYFEWKKVTCIVLYLM